ncbi:DUF3189 family protein [Paramaledivibacter caminithermalis]|jgi:hypothetical protein|uniref:DUF3189 family protein n=1 Tax=Paramaledivibacter caminithermalis (strain DSM 15212 / CIP 107654 / DViRD3) TaxID=1121301 RepID=A0A1M6PD20_PARC5|nr:DUF3189 family protein [Paramaledivibacter caminithermalis]SHK05839.1 Protein of unknown function [Paramaledivibacter caminithermalis DSM 15212]
MHIVYHCATGCHSSSTAAAIHLGILPIEYKPSYHDLISVPFYDALEKKDRGRLIYRGIDDKGNSIYTLGRKYISHLILPVILDTWKIFNQSPNNLILINTQPCVNGFMKFGGYLSRNLKLTKIGRPIVAKGTLYSYKNIANIVKDTKRLLS